MPLLMAEDHWVHQLDAVPQVRSAPDEHIADKPHTIHYS